MKQFKLNFLKKTLIGKVLFLNLASTGKNLINYC